jgi:hypothetical protein
MGLFCHAFVLHNHNCVFFLNQDNQYRLLQAVVKKGWDTLGQLLEAPNSVQQKLANPNVLPWEIHGS